MVGATEADCQGSAVNPQTAAAVAYAQRMHSGQRRADGTEYVLHPLEVGSLLNSAGAPDHLVAAGVLHDVLEKTDATASELREQFGPRVTALVVAVSDDERITSYKRRKAALRQQVARSGPEALTLFGADKLSKLRELRRRAHDLRARRLDHYQRSVALLEELLPQSPLVPQLHEELGKLLRERRIAAA